MVRSDRERSGATEQHGTVMVATDRPPKGREQVIIADVDRDDAWIAMAVSHTVNTRSWR